jgi:hypothetical protein
MQLSTSKILDAQMRQQTKTKSCALRASAFASVILPFPLLLVSRRLQNTHTLIKKTQTTKAQMANVQMAAQMTNVRKLCSEAHAQTPQALMVDKALLFPLVFQVTIAQHPAQVRFLRGA